MTRAHKSLQGRVIDGCWNIDVVNRLLPFLYQSATRTLRFAQQKRTGSSTYRSTSVCSSKDLIPQHRDHGIVLDWLDSNLGLPRHMPALCPLPLRRKVSQVERLQGRNTARLEGQVLGLDNAGQCEGIGATA